MTIAKPEPKISNVDVQERFGGEIRNGWVYGITVLEQAVDGYAVDGRLYLQNASDGAYTAKELAAYANMVLNPGLPLHPSQKRALNADDAPPKPDAANDNKPVRATSFKLRDPALIPERDWLFDHHYIRRYLTETVGAGGGGKSAHAVSEVLPMVTGRPLLDPDGPLGKKLRVWYINCEDPNDEIERRFAAAAVHFGVTDEQIGGRLFTNSGRDNEFVIMRQVGREFKVCEPFVDAMATEIKANAIDIVIVDPFVSTHEVPENDNSAIQRVAKAWLQVAEKGNCGIDVIHHIVKGAEEVTADSGRGGGALKDKARSVRTINPMSHAQAKEAGVDDRRDYFRVDLGKVNMTKSTGSQWRRFESVGLGNGKGLVKTGDSIGVVVPWRWPSAASRADLAAAERAVLVADVPADLLAGIKVRLDNSDHKASVQAEHWAGRIVAEVLGIDLEDKAERKRVAEMIEAWIEAGELQIVRIPDANRRVTPHVKSGCGTTENEVPQV